MDLTNINNLLGEIVKVLKIPKPKDPQISPYLVLASKARGGMSAQEMSAEIIKRRTEAGLPVGTLPDGEVNPDEVMELIRCQVIIDAITAKARTTVAIQPGQTVFIQGQTATGTPLYGTGQTVSVGIGNAIIQ